MNFDRINKAVCIIPPAPQPDARCLNSDFALANPSICSAIGALIIKPAILILCVGDSIRFQVYEFKNGIETLLTTEISFSSSDEDVFSIGINSGSGTSLAAGQVTITGTHDDGRTVSAAMLVNAANACCAEETIAAAIVVDRSRSMTLGFGGSYVTRLNFAKAVASSFVDGLGVGVSSVTQASISTLANDPEELEPMTANKTDLQAAISSIVQTDQKTDLLDVFTTLTDTLLAVTASRRIIVLISDGEHTADSNRQAVIDAAALFKAAGGIVIVMGARASGVGYDLLERIATGGYFVNATGTTAASAISQLHYLSSLICAGHCAPAGDTFENRPELNYSSFLNWEVIQGMVNLLGPGLLDFLPGNGMYVELAASDTKGLIRTIDPINIIAGRSYRISFSAAGNQRLAIAGQGIKVFIREAGADDADPNIFEAAVYPAWDSALQTFSFTFTPLFDASVRINFEQLGTDSNPAAGNLLDLVKFDDVSTQTNILNDDFGDENLTYIPPACGPSGAIAPIADAPEPMAEYVSDDVLIVVPGAAVWNGAAYIYGVTWVTNEGETATYAAGTNTRTIATSPTSNSGTRVFLPTPPAGVISVRVWRNSADGSEPMYLLATVTPETAFYDDTETHSQFTARMDDSVTSPTTNTTGKTAGELGFGYDCYLYDCTSEPPGVQSPDSSPLPDIESGFVPPTTYTSTKTVCATCPTGQESVSSDNLIPEMTSATTPSGTVFSSAGAAIGFEAWRVFDRLPGTFMDLVGTVSGVVGYQFTAAVVVTHYTMVARGDYVLGSPRSWTFEGSNNGSTWVVLDTQTSVSWFAGESKSFPISNTTSYAYYRLNITNNVSGNLSSNLSLAALEMFSGGVAQVCKTATETSFVSQQDADTKATAAATLAANAELNCVPFYTATESFTAVCPFNQFGASITKSATRKSYVSQADAEAQALAAAQADAEAELDCTFSNNDQNTVINDITKASPYPSVSYHSGLGTTITKVVVNLVGLTHPSPEDILMLLLAPDGVTGCMLMVRCGGLPPNAISGVNLVLDQAAGSALPDSTQIVSGTFRPAAYGAGLGSGLLPLPVPIAATYGTTLNVFNGLNPNGSWSLFIYDSLSVFDGSLASWSLTITAS